MLTAWKFSEEHEAVTKYHSILAHAASLTPSALLACVNALVRYYQSCFPESEKAAQQNLFTPIPDGSSGESASPSPCCSQADTPTLLRFDQTAADQARASPRQGGASSVPPTPTTEGPASKQ